MELNRKTNEDEKDQGKHSKASRSSVHKGCKKHTGEWPRGKTARESRCCHICV